MRKEQLEYQVVCKAWCCSVSLGYIRAALPVPEAISSPSACAGLGRTLNLVNILAQHLAFGCEKPLGIQVKLTGP